MSDAPFSGLQLIIPGDSIVRGGDVFVSWYILLRAILKHFSQEDLQLCRSSTVRCLKFHMDSFVDAVQKLYMDEHLHRELRSGC